MCGIAGFFYRDGSREASLDELKPMLDEIVHRGPDDWGYHLDGPLGFGMRRLSIIDIETGQQPVHNEDKTVWAVFNGEIYNFVELRPMLEAKGHRFYTKGDTEVIVHLWEEYGPEFVHHLRGMFGIALWDSRTKQFMLVRDRLGIKPLYYSETARGLFFGSELKCLLAHSAVKRQPDYDAINAYLELQYIPAPMSAIQGIRKLLPGHYMLLQNGRLTIREYWDAPLAPEVNGRSYDDFKEELEAELVRVVKMQLITDVPLGVFLSGGVDSSLVAILMAREMGEPVKSFSIGFDHEEFDELKYARVIAERYETEHHEEIVHADAIDLLPKLVRFYDEPFADSSAIPTYYVSRMARRHVTVVLSGDGGDEIFGGYTRYRDQRKYERFDRMLGPLRRPMFGAATKLLPFPLNKRAILHRLSRSLQDIYRDQMSFFTPLWLERVAPHPPIDGKRNGVASWDEWWKRAEGNPFLLQLGYVDMKTYMVDDCLVKTDRASMAASLETRVPFLDHKIVELASKMPLDHKIRGDISKYILKDILRPHVPDGFADRPKMGFGVPLVEWFRRDLRDYVRDRLLSQRARQRGLFDMRFVEQMIDYHQSGRMNLSGMLWALLFLEEWFRIYVDRDQTPSSD